VVRLHPVGDDQPGPRAPGRKPELFAPPRKPGPAPGTASAKDRVRGRVIELRRQGLSTYEISRRLKAVDTPLNRTSVAEILAEEWFGRLLRHPEPEASISPATPGRDTNWPAAAVIDFSTCIDGSLQGHELIGQPLMLFASHGYAAAYDVENVLKLRPADPGPGPERWGISTRPRVDAMVRPTWRSVA
jgi:hypothetical protein